MPSGCPPEGAAVHAKSWPLVLARFYVLIHQLWGNTNYVLPFPIFNHVHALQGGYYVRLSDTRHLAERNVINQ